MNNKRKLIVSECIEQCHLSQSNGNTVNEIQRWFGENTESVLRFHSLYHAFGGFPSDAKYIDIEEKISQAVIKRKIQ